jgi:D-threo-aldose 1-dehydrogenase
MEGLRDMQQRKFGRTNLVVTELGLGGSPLGNRASPISEAQSESIIDSAWNQGIRYFDTAPLYGHGLAEARLGLGLRWKPRAEFVVSSKVGRILQSAPRETIDYGPWAGGLPFACRYDYSCDGARRALEDSLQRLGIEQIEIALIHDIDVFTFGDRQPEMFREAMAGAYRALVALRDEKTVKAIGIGVNEWQPCYQALLMGDFDCFLLAGRYTLLEQAPLDAFLPLCEQRGAAVIIGGGFNSGILATGSIANARYNYGPASPEILAKVRQIEAICAQYAVPLPAAAHQFILAHPAVASHIPGARTPEQIQQNVAWATHPIPSDLWRDLQRADLLRDDAPTPH